MLNRNFSNPATNNEKITVFFKFLLSSADFFKTNFSKNVFQEHESIRVSNHGFDQDKNRRFFGPALRPNSL